MSFSNAPNMSFSSQHSQPQQSPHHPLLPQAPLTQNGHVQHSPYRSFDQPGQPLGTRFSYEKPQIYSAVYSGVKVYEMEVNGIASMRRISDGWLNATQILKVAGVDKGKRTKVLEKEILTGEHEKVQGGYGKYQGTWVSYTRGREFCRQYGVEEILRPLLEYELNGDATNPTNTQDTPTKEQAMAANRKKFYNASTDTRANPQLTNGTFFSNISPMSSVAIAAMNKAARLNSPVRGGNNLMRRQSQNQGAGLNASQTSMASENSFSGHATMDSGYATQNGGNRGDEPPRKRMRQSEEGQFSQPSMLMDVSMRSGSPTEPNESFLFSQSQQYADTFDGDDPITQPPLPTPTSQAGEEKRALLLDLFAEQTRTDFATHPALLQLSADDYNIPLDASANTALHWAATLARVPLLRLLLQRGANMWRGNAAGQSALISAVLVNNCWEHSCFPDLLELLGPLIEVRDATGRTILHHIAVACGIKGRAPSSKYYLEALLEFLVRSVPHNGGASVKDMANEASQDSHSAASTRGPMSLMRFLSTILNAQDKAGNTALNLVARIGNRSIIQQLLEIKADPNIPNHKGVSARDFGVGVEDGSGTGSVHLNGSTYQQSAEFVLPSSEHGGTAQGQEGNAGNASLIEDQNQDVISSLTSMLTQNLNQHKTILASKTSTIDLLNAQIRELSATQKQESDTLQALQKRARLRDDRLKKIQNLRRLVQQTQQHQHGRPNSSQGTQKKRKIGDADASVISLNQHHHHHLQQQQQQYHQHPHQQDLKALIRAYTQNNTLLSHRSQQLKSQSLDTEALYRRVVSLCTNVPEDSVEENLNALVAAVESERGVLAPDEVGRVREFLMKVEGGGGGGGGGGGLPVSAASAAGRAGVIGGGGIDAGGGAREVGVGVLG